MYEEYLIRVAELNFGFKIVCLVMVLVLIACIVEVRKTKKYRREIGDLYVVGKIKQIATKDGVDLIKEKLDFLDWNKKNKVKDSVGNRNFDDVVEEEMKEKVSEGFSFAKAVHRETVKPTKKKKGKK